MHQHTRYIDFKNNPSFRKFQSGPVLYPMLKLKFIWKPQDRSKSFLWKKFTKIQCLTTLHITISKVSFKPVKWIFCVWKSAVLEFRWNFVCWGLAPQFLAFLNYYFVSTNLCVFFIDFLRRRLFFNFRRPAFYRFPKTPIVVEYV